MPQMSKNCGTICNGILLSNKNEEVLICATTWVDHIDIISHANLQEQRRLYECILRNLEQAKLLYGESHQFSSRGGESE